MTPVEQGTGGVSGLSCVFYGVSLPYIAQRPQGRSPAGLPSPLFQDKDQDQDQMFSPRLYALPGPGKVRSIHGR